MRSDANIRLELTVDEVCQQTLEHLMRRLQFPEQGGTLVIELDGKRFASAESRAGVYELRMSCTRNVSWPINCVGSYAYSLSFGQTLPDTRRTEAGRRCRDRARKVDRGQKDRWALPASACRKSRAFDDVRRAWGWNYRSIMPASIFLRSDPAMQFPASCHRR